MPRRRSTRSYSLPIVLASITILLAVAMLVGWTLLVARNFGITRQVARNTSLLLSGIVSLAVIIAVVVLLLVFLIREMREVLRQNSFIDSVTHELKSPLASLKLCLDTLERPELSDEQARSLRRTMAESVERLTLFIDDILQASLHVHGRGGHVLKEVALLPLVERCRSVVATRYHIGPEAVRVDVPADVVLTTDPMALEIVLKNLLDNAVKYSPEDDVKIEVSVDVHDPARIDVIVRDHGIGVPRKALRRIFDRFYRVPSEEVRARHGTGLGLFVVSALVRNLGGRIRALSAGAGQGTSVIVSLPTVRAAVATVPSGQAMVSGAPLSPPGNP